MCSAGKSFLTTYNDTDANDVFNRFEGSAHLYDSYASTANMIKKQGHNMRRADEYLDESEVVTRIMHVLNQFSTYDLRTLDWSKNFSDQGIDSLEQIAIITSLEHEFHTVFEDNVFDSMETLN